MTCSNITISFKTLFKAAGIILLCVVIGFSLLLLVFCLPTGRIETNVCNSFGQLLRETDWFAVASGFPGSTLDNYTDAVYLNEALVGSDGNAVNAALSGYRFTSDSALPVGQLADYFYGYSTGISNMSVRFWNGYEAVLKPLLSFFVYSGIRQLNLLFETFLLMVLFWLMMKKGLREYIPAVLVAVLLLNPLSLALCVTYAGFWYCTLIPCIIMLLANDFLHKNNRYVYFFIIIGCAVIYFNVNYFQLISFGFPFVFYYMLNGFYDVKDVIKKAAVLFCSWFMGYAVMMNAKWVLYAGFIDSAIFAQMAESILGGTSGELNQETFSRFSAISRNLHEAFGYKSWSLIEIGFVAYCVFSGIKRKSVLNGCGKHIVLVLAMMILVLGRFYVFADHVFVHYWTTYRILAIPVLALNVFLMNFKKTA